MEELVLGYRECCRLIDSLDFYSRIWIGQYGEIERRCKLLYLGDAGGFERESDVRERELLEMRNLVMPDIARFGLSGSYGIWSPQTSDLAKSAYDMQQIIRHDLSWHLHPEGGLTVDFNAPLLKGSLPQVSCRVIGSSKADVSVAVTLCEENRALMERAVRAAALCEAGRLREMMGEYTDNVHALEIAEKLGKGRAESSGDAGALSSDLGNLLERLGRFRVKPLSAPEFDGLLRLAERSCGDGFANGEPGFCSPRLNVAIQLLLEEMKPIKETGHDGYREIWIEVPRGDFSDYRRLVEEEYRWEGEDSPPTSEIEQRWREAYPDSGSWYRVGSARYGDWLSVGVNGPLRFLSAPKARHEDFFDSERIALLLFLSAKIESGIKLLQLGTYDDDLRKRLPYKWRRGKIERSALWGISEDYRVGNLGCLSDEEIERFCGLAMMQLEEGGSERLPAMTAQMFFECCEAGYRACGKDGKRWDGERMADAMAWYKRYGYDDSARICKIDPNSPGEFDAWYTKNEHRFDHTFQIAGAHGYSRLDLRPTKDERGWYFLLCHLNDFQLVEIVRFFLAVNSLGYPVALDYPEVAVKMLHGEDWVGIVRRSSRPVYCQGDFPDEKIFGFINLPDGEEGRKVAECAEWYPLEKVELAFSDSN